MRDALRIELLKRFRTQSDAAGALGLAEPRLSRILRGRDEPSRVEKEKLVTLFGRRRLARLLKTETSNIVGAQAAQI